MHAHWWVSVYLCVCVCASQNAKSHKFLLWIPDKNVEPLKKEQARLRFWNSADLKGKVCDGNSQLRKFSIQWPGSFCGSIIWLGKTQFIEVHWTELSFCEVVRPPVPFVFRALLKYLCSTFVLTWERGCCQHVLRKIPHGSTVKHPVPSVMRNPTTDKPQTLKGVHGEWKLLL